MGLLDQIFAGVGGAASGATEQMNVSAELRRRREALEAQRESDINERLYRQDQLSRQEARDAALDTNAKEQLRLTGEAQRLGAAKAERTEAAAAERERVRAEREGRAETRADRRLGIMERNAGGRAGRDSKLTDSPRYEAMSTRQRRARDDTSSMNQTLTRLEAEDQTPQRNAEMQTLRGRINGRQKEIEARDDSLGVLEDRFSGGPAPAGLFGTGSPAPGASQPAPTASKDPNGAAFNAGAAALKRVYEGMVAKYPDRVGEARAIYQRKMSELTKQYYPSQGR